MGGDTLKLQMPPEYRNKNCDTCGEEFTPASSTHKYCSTPCMKSGAASTLLLYRYGITLEEYEEMFERCGGKCQICGKDGLLPDKNHKTTLVVDHDHETDEVRGLLCNACNTSLGHLNDDVTLLAKSIVYLSAKK